MRRVTGPRFNVDGQRYFRTGASDCDIHR
jgi:hypothetical protein